MRSVKFGLLFLCAAFPGALGHLASGTGKDSMHLGIPLRPSVQYRADEPDESETPITTDDPPTDTRDPSASEPADPPASETTEAPVPTATPPTNPIIENITWEGTGCPARASEDETASVQVELEEDGSFGVYTFDNFDVYLGWSETQEIETEAECTISMGIVGIPEGWSFQIDNVQAQGYIYLLQGAVAVFNSTVFWSGNEEHVVSLFYPRNQAVGIHSGTSENVIPCRLTSIQFEAGKYWPNDQETPVDQVYLTDPLLLTSENQTEFGSPCTAVGDGPGSGTLNINFRLSMQSDTDPAPNGIVTISALGIANKLVECDAPESAPVTRCKKKKRRPS
ncbi:hypothetical protein VUR80DRAFT_9591 [Thermomyces stellatus]